MESIIAKLIESSVSAALLMIILWVFLPRLIKSIDRLTEVNSREHEAIATMFVHLEQRLNWHEARQMGLYPEENGAPNDKNWRAAVDNFQRANAGLEDLGEDLKRLFRGAN